MVNKTARQTEGHVEKVFIGFKTRMKNDLVNHKSRTRLLPLAFDTVETVCRPEKATNVTSRTVERIRSSEAIKFVVHK